jgi:hypothetical protein
MLEVAPPDLVSRRQLLLWSLGFTSGAAMDANLQTHLSAAALVVAVLALFFSLVAAFPGMKGVLAAVRDGVLWFALFLVIGGVSFVVWQRLQQSPGLAAAAGPPTAVPAGDPAAVDAAELTPR